jgi:hypothetical protein
MQEMGCIYREVQGKEIPIGIHAGLSEAFKGSGEGIGARSEEVAYYYISA